MAKANAKKTGKLTAVEWFWRGDKNDWNVYDLDMCCYLEEEFQKGTKKVPVDKERFIDLSLDQKEVIKNFTKGVSSIEKGSLVYSFSKTLDDEENVVGLQRRYDDENKRRAIRRVAPEFFGKGNGRVNK
jgi:hypothetical protein